MSLGRSLAALGAIAGGYVKGDRMLKEDARLEEDRAFQKEQRGRQRAAWVREDTELDIEQGAKAAFKNAYDATAPGLDQAGAAATSSTMNVPANQAPMPGEPPASLAAVPTPAARPADPEAQQRRLLAGLEAQANFYGSRGAAPKFKEAWTEAAKLRGQIRAKEFERADGEYRATGDPLVYARRVYPLISDGEDFVDGALDKDELGRPVVNVTTRNQATGKQAQVSVPVDRFMDRVAWARNPEKVLEKEAAFHKAMFEHGLAVARDGAQEAARGNQTRQTEGLRHTNSLALEDVRTTNNVNEIRERGKQDRSTKATPSYGDRNFTLSDGAERYTTNKDGKLVKVAGNDKSATGKIDWTGLTAKHYGESLGGLSGTRAATPETMAMAISAQEIYEANKDRPGMTPEKAIEMAAKTHKPRKPN